MVFIFLSKYRTFSYKSMLLRFHNESIEMQQNELLQTQQAFIRDLKMKKRKKKKKKYQSDLILQKKYQKKPKNIKNNKTIRHIIKNVLLSNTYTLILIILVYFLSITPFLDCKISRTRNKNEIFWVKINRINSVCMSFQNFSCWFWFINLFKSYKILPYHSIGLD